MASINEVYLGYGVVHNDKSCRLCEGLQADLKPVRACLSVKLVMIALFMVSGLITAYIMAMVILYHTTWVVK